MATYNVILEAFIEVLKNNKNKQSIKQELESQSANLLDVRADFLTPLEFYKGQLDSTDAVMFQYMTAEQKKSAERRIQITYLLLLAQKQQEHNLGTYTTLTEYDSKINKCSRLLDALNPNIEKQSAPARSLTDGKPVAYLGLVLGQEVAKRMVDLPEQALPWSDQLTNKITDFTYWSNGLRLYWVWASSFLKTVLAVIPPDFYNAAAADEAMHTADPYTGILSWTLYYFRFSLHLSLLLRHTIAGPWMSKEESEIPWTERFTTQWSQRKFALLNDSIWATGNLACFFWLTTAQGLGPWGDLLTIGLLVFDLTLTLLGF